MDLRMVFQAILLLFFIHVISCTYYKVRHREQFLIGNNSIPEESYISCTCYGISKRIDIQKKDTQNIYEKLRSLEFCELDKEIKNGKEICHLQRYCGNCSFHTVECQLISKSYKKYNCQKKSFEFLKKTSLDPKNDSLTRLRLHKRQKQFCPLPENSETFDLICKRYSSFVTCHQICIHGYTLKKGIARRRRCLYKENVWKPTDFKECRPFVDCGMTLISPGFLECFPGSTTDSPSCNVSCDAFGDKSATPMDTYGCQITGSWNKELPFCVIPKSGKELVPAPKINLYPFLDDLLKKQETRK